MKKRGKKPPPNAPAFQLDAEEQELFLQAYHTGVVEKQKTVTIEPNLVKTRPQTDDLNQDERELFLQAVRQGVMSLEPSISPEKPLAAKKSTAKKRRMPDQVLDLHGMVAEQAVQVLLEFIYREKARGSRNLLVVHGKGAGILRNAVWGVLETHPGIDDFQVAPAKLGGGGALIVRINRKKRR